MIFKKIISSDCLIITSSYFLRFLKVILNSGYIRNSLKQNNFLFGYKQKKNDLIVCYNNNNNNNNDDDDDDDDVVVLININIIPNNYPKSTIIFISLTLLLIYFLFYKHENGKKFIN